MVDPTDSDTGSDSSEPIVTKKMEVCNDDADVTPEPLQPDNQLGLWDWDGNPLENPPDLKEEDMATPPTPHSDLSPEEKRKRFWKKFVVPWPPLNSTPDSKMENDSESDSEPRPSSSGIKRDTDTRSHRNSPTLTLSPKAGDRKSSDGGSDSESDSSSMSLVGEGAFEEAMVSSSAAAHKKAAASTTPMSTLHTPPCERPDWWGFPLVETPPKVKVPRLDLQYDFVAVKTFSPCSQISFCKICALISTFNQNLSQHPRPCRHRSVLPLPSVAKARSASNLTRTRRPASSTARSK